ncbi:MAG: hypothetical protein AAGN35_22665 [Bacteroidota bacterium]
MKKQFGIICTAGILILFLSSCKNQALQSDKCRAFWDSVREDWVYDEEEATYSIQAKAGRKNMDFIRHLIYDREDCWKGISKKQVKKVFGEPSKIQGDRWNYYIDAECFERRVQDCNYFSFLVSDREGLIDVELNAYSIIE